MNKQTLLLKVILLICFAQLKGQSPNWVWAQGFGGWGPDYATTVITDNYGNIYFSGGSSSNLITFDSIAFSSPGALLVKFNNDGHVLWATNTNTGLVFNSITTDDLSNVYAIGTFDSYFGVFGNDTLINAGGGSFTDDLFLVKYDSSGNMLWVKGAGGPGRDMVQSIKCDSSNNIYIVGFFESDSIIFGTTTLFNTNFIGSDMFIAKYDSAGNSLWAKNSGGIESANATCITSDASLNVYVGGYFFCDSISFGSFILNDSSIFSEIFIVKYDSNGNVIWAKSAGDGGGQIANISSDLNGSIYLSGSFRKSTIPFGSFLLINDTTNYSNDIFIVKADTSGNFLWAQRAGGSDNDYATSIQSDANGNVFLSGDFSSSSITFGSTTLSNSGFFITKYDSSGNSLWAKEADSGVGYVNCLAKDFSTENIYITGVSPYLTSLTLGSTTLTNVGYTDIFLAKLDVSNGVNETNENNISLNVIPNPFSNELMIRGTSGKGELIIFDLAGHAVLKSKTSQVVTTMNANNLQKGFYLLHYLEENKCAIYKLIKL